MKEQSKGKILDLFVFTVTGFSPSHPGFQIWRQIERHLPFLGVTCGHVLDTGIGKAVTQPSKADFDKYELKLEERLEQITEALTILESIQQQMLPELQEEMTPIQKKLATVRYDKTTKEPSVIAGETQLSRMAYAKGKGVGRKLDVGVLEVSKDRCPIPRPWTGARGH